MTLSIESFLDELEKIAAAGAKLNPEERRNQMLQFAGLGAAAAPAISGVKNLIGYGKVSPFTSVKRWLPAQVVGGALAGGAIPAVQHMMAQGNLRKARGRVEAEKTMRQLTPGGVRKSLSALPEKDPTLEVDDAG